MTDQPTLDIDLCGVPVTVAERTAFDRFWRDALDGGWEEDTFAFIAEHIRPGTVFLDIGAWIGPISLAAAGRGARVIALEPDPVAHESLTRNVALNVDRLSGSIEVLAAGFGPLPGTIELFAQRDGFGTSATSAVRAGGGESVTRPVITPDELIAMIDPGERAVMKVDIEAYEYECAAAIARLRRELDAPLHLSVHPATLRKSMTWPRWLGLAAGRVQERTEALFDAFEDCEIRATDAPEGVHGPDLRQRLRPASGRVRDFSVTITSRGQG